MKMLGWLAVAVLVSTFSFACVDGQTTQFLADINARAEQKMIEDGVDLKAADIVTVETYLARAAAEISKERGQAPDAPTDWGGLLLHALGIYFGGRTVAAAVTPRGWDNVAHAFDRKSGVRGVVDAALAIYLDKHTAPVANKALKTTTPTTTSVMGSP